MLFGVVVNFRPAGSDFGAILSRRFAVEADTENAALRSVDSDLDWSNASFTDAHSMPLAFFPARSPTAGHPVCLD